jgi:hypothetical protein
MLEATKGKVCARLSWENTVRGPAPFFLPDKAELRVHAQLSITLQK